MNNYIKIGMCVFATFAHMNTHTMEREPEAPTIDSCTYSVSWDFRIQETLPFQRIRFINEEDAPPKPVGIIGKNTLKGYTITIKENETDEYELSFFGKLPDLKYTIYTKKLPA